MWIKIDKGDLCNLALATDILVASAFSGDGYRVEAFFGDSDTATTLASFAEKKDAEAYREGLWTKLNPREVLASLGLS